MSEDARHVLEDETVVGADEAIRLRFTAMGVGEGAETTTKAAAVTEAAAPLTPAPSLSLTATETETAAAAAAAAAAALQSGTTAASSAPTPPSAPPPFSGKRVVVVEDDEDEDLRRALQMSLEDLGGPDAEEAAAAAANKMEATTTTTTTTRKMATTAMNHSGPPPLTTTTSDVVVEISRVPVDLKSFHSIMWDDAATTPGDKARWLGQSIDTEPTLLLSVPSPGLLGADNDDDDDDAAYRGDGDDEEVYGDGSSSSSSLLAEKDDDDDDADADGGSSFSPRSGSRKTRRTVVFAEGTAGGWAEGEGEPDLSSLLGPISKWGLVQSHGGPCGVLAAVQAETLRILLYGRRRNRRTRHLGSRRRQRIGNRSSSGGDGGGGDVTERKTRSQERRRVEFSLDYPEIPATPDRLRLATAVDDDNVANGSIVREALARAIGIVLARAAVTPPPPPPPSSAASADGAPSRGMGTRAEVRVVLPAPSPIADLEAGISGRGGWASRAAGGRRRGPDGAYYVVDHDEEEKGDGPFSSTDMDGAVALVDAGGRGGLTLDMLDPSRSVAAPALCAYSVRVDSSCAVAAGGQGAGDKPEFKRFKGNEAAVGPSEDGALDDLVLRLAEATSSFLLGGVGSYQGAEPPLSHFHRPGGVLLLALSLIESRSPAVIRSDTDDPDSARLTAQFGHSSQELINLLLTGRATSNVFDGELSVGGGLQCRGIQSRPDVGYLSQLESLRYCEVGTYYKTPRFPLWVIGSTSHFSVLFGSPGALRESRSDALLERCRRAFKSVEGAEERGFVDTAQLGGLVRSLGADMWKAVGGEAGVKALEAALEVSGAGIILWDDFWRSASRLLTGASLQVVLQGDEGDGGGAAAAAAATGGGVGGGSSASDSGDVAQPPMLLTQYGEARGGGEGGTAHRHSARAAGIESDEEMAKRLAEEWGTAPTALSASSSLSSTSSPAVASYVAPGASPPETTLRRAKTDEELARELQAQWDAEDAAAASASGGSTMGATDGSLATLTADLDDRRMGADKKTAAGAAATTKTTGLGAIDEQGDTDIGIDDEGKPPARVAPQPTRGSPSLPASPDAGRKGVEKSHPKRPLAFERYGDTFRLYHYNGLRGGLLTPFRVTRLSPEEAVGASIALSQHGGVSSGGTEVGGGGGLGNSNHGSGDLEDVVRTRYPSCIFDWGGVRPPFID